MKPRLYFRWKSFAMVFAIVISIIGLASSAHTAEDHLEAGAFLTLHLPKYEVKHLSLEEALEVLRREAAKVAGAKVPELPVSRYVKRQPSREFPFGEADSKISFVLEGGSVYQCLKLVTAAFGCTVEFDDNTIAIFEVPALNLGRGDPIPTPVDMLTVAEFMKLKLPKYQVEQLEIEGAVATLRAGVLKVAGKRAPPIAIIRYPYADAFRDRSSPLVTLDLHDVPVDQCFRYITELSGCSYTVTPDRIAAREVLFPICYPKYPRMFSVADFAKAMKRKKSQVTTDSVFQWLAQEPKVDCLVEVNQRDNLVFVGWLGLEDEMTLLRRLGIQR